MTAIRVVHRVHGEVTLLKVIGMGVASATGVLSGAAALRILLFVEIPLLLVFVVLTVIRARRMQRTPGSGTPGSGARGSGPTGWLSRLEAEEPLLRPVVAELRSFQALFLALVGRQRVPGGARGFGYTRGTLTIPAVMIGVSVVEMFVVHLLVPWEWLRILLLVLSVWGILFIAGFFAARIVHPHLVHDDRLLLRWGHREVLDVPISSIVAAEHHLDHARTQPEATEDCLVLTQFQSTNVRIRFESPVPVEAPASRKREPRELRTSSALLYVDEPERFLRAIQEARDTVVR